MAQGQRDWGGISFGPFRLLPAERRLERNGVAVHLGGRSLDILVALAERAGDVVSKRDLLAAVWPDVTVDEGSLRFHVAALRKALGDGLAGARYVTNVSGRGYCLVAPISHARTSDAAEPTKGCIPSRGLPPCPSGIVGREGTLQEIAKELLALRFVTIVGPGGIGKTTVAVTAAHALLEAFDGAVHFIDLGALHEARLVPSVLASSLGLILHSDDPVPGLLAALKDKRMLLVLDNCEHVIEAVAALAENIFKEAPQIHILATSRESLRVDGERVHRLFPLGCPPEDANPNASEVLAFPATRLFVERAAAGSHQFELGDAEAPIVAEICRKLDGIALAIELAAGRVDAYGIDGVAVLLNSRLELLWQGRRTALPRHQTLRATLDWSYDLLSEIERTVLRRLAIFVGAFSLEAARAVVASDEIEEAHVVEAIGNLVAKSLLSSDASAAPVRYRLLDTMRVYLLAQPVAPDEADATARRHATYWCQHLDLIGTETAASADAREFAQSRALIGNLRSALEWSFSARGDAALAVALAAASSQFFLEMSLLTECHRWSEQAITALDGASAGSRREMQLQASYAVSLMFTRGNDKNVRAAFARGLELAETLDDPHYQLQLLSGFHLYMTRVADFRGALMIAQQSEGVARRLGDTASMIVAGWTMGVTHHLIGNQAKARVHCETATVHRIVPQWGNIRRLGHDHRILALVAHARALWLGGYPDQATRAARRAIEEAETLDHPPTLCTALIWSATVLLWAGDWPSAEQTIERLLAHAAKHSLAPDHAVGLGLKGRLLMKRGDPDAGLPLVRGGIEAMRGSRHQIVTTAFVKDLAEGLAAMGRFEEGLAAIDSVIAMVGGAGESFDFPDILRIKGDILHRSPAADDEEAESCLREALDFARKQSALGWELRAAVSLAELWLKAGRSRDALTLLAPIWAKFTEGFETADLKSARRLLDRLSATPQSRSDWRQIHHRIGAVRTAVSALPLVSEAV